MEEARRKTVRETGIDRQTDRQGGQRRRVGHRKASRAVVPNALPTNHAIIIIKKRWKEEEKEEV